MDIPSRESNPSNAPEKGTASRTRIPMSVPQARLSVPDMPGFHLHWMLGTADRIQQAKRAGYTFVEKDDVLINNRGIADDPLADGGTDMGSRVSVTAGSESEAGQPVQLILMKLPLEWWDEDQKALEKQSDQLVATLRAGRLSAAESGELVGDLNQRYVDRKRTKDFFTKRRA